MDKYQEFLESIRPYNPTLVEGVARAYTLIFEEVSDRPIAERRLSLAERRAAKQASTPQPSQNIEPTQPTTQRTEPRWLSRSDMTQSKYMDRLEELGYPPEIKKQIIEIIRRLRWISEESKKTTSSGKSVSSLALDEINKLEKNVILGLTQGDEESLSDYIGNLTRKWNIDLNQDYLPAAAEPEDDELVDEEEDPDYHAGY